MPSAPGKLGKWQKGNLNRPAGLIEKMHIGNGIIIRLRLRWIGEERELLTAEGSTQVGGR